MAKRQGSQEPGYFERSHKTGLFEGDDFRLPDLFEFPFYYLKRKFRLMQE
jgi:hypothetical protein